MDRPPPAAFVCVAHRLVTGRVARVRNRSASAGREHALGAFRQFRADLGGEGEQFLVTGQLIERLTRQGAGLVQGAGLARPAGTQQEEFGAAGQNTSRRRTARGGQRRISASIRSRTGAGAGACRLV